MPLFSVVIPAYKRPKLLRRAAQSVLDQTFTDFELIISDDDPEIGESWALAKSLEDADPRVRAVRNPGPRGQDGNTNHLLGLATGEWIKPLHDDDVLRPRCLETFAVAVRGAPTAVLASCGVVRFRGGVPFDDRPLETVLESGNPLLRLVRGHDAVLGDYLQDCPAGVMPSQVLVHRSAIERGVLWASPPGIDTTGDSWWASRLCTIGDLLIVDVPLAEWRQGEETSLTARTPLNHLDDELIALRTLQHGLIPEAMNPPPLPDVVQSLRLIRAAARLGERRVLDAARLAAGALRPGAWGLFARWALRRAGWARSRVPARSLPDEAVRRVLTRPLAASSARPGEPVAPADAGFSPRLIPAPAR